MIIALSARLGLFMSFSARLGLFMSFFSDDVANRDQLIRLFGHLS
jgi:hypothetical protein